MLYKHTTLTNFLKINLQKFIQKMHSNFDILKIKKKKEKTKIKQGKHFFRHLKVSYVNSQSVNDLGE